MFLHKKTGQNDSDDYMTPEEEAMMEQYMMMQYMMKGKGKGYRNCKKMSNILAKHF